MNTPISVELCSFWSPQSGDPNERPARAAWVSTTDKDKAEGKSEHAAQNVIQTLVSSLPPHKSPLEFVYYEFWIKCPISIERQIDKHRISIQEQDFELTWWGADSSRVGLSQNELSGRYRTMPDEWMEWPKDIKDQRALAIKFENHMKDCFDVYRLLLNSVPSEWKNKHHPKNKQYKRIRETVRNVLPLGTMTQMRVILNLSSLKNMIDLRLHPDAQPEAQLVAAYMVNELVAHNALPTPLVDEWEPRASKLIMAHLIDTPPRRGLNPDE